ncbi:MAG: hydrogenase iron-sulfur subunit [Desulfobacterales bacterium]|nr:hydrogenase iron-sulfur subunit [Desulfobacterales bacterium]
MKRRILIFGSGEQSVKVANKFVQNNFEATIISNELHKYSELNSIKFINKSEIISAKGFIGNFTISLKTENDIIDEKADIIIIAEEYLINNNLYNLVSSNFLYNLSDFKNKIDYFSHDFLNNKTIAFITGINEESWTYVLKDILESCLKLQSIAKLKTFVFTKNLKVGYEGIEKLYRLTKESGTFFFKFTDSTPKITNTNDSKVLIEFIDEIISQNFKLTPDITVVDYKVTSNPYLQKIAEVLKLNLDEYGFIQTDNVHRLPIFTNKKGILVAGNSRCVQSDEENNADIDNLISESISLFNGYSQDSKLKANVNYGRCAKCLTCYRSCPYGAIIFDEKIIIEKESCYGCGICSSSCPARAIELDTNDNSKFTYNLFNSKLHGDANITKDDIYVFCCERSACKAYKSAISLNLKIPSNIKIFEVPCTGSISTNEILYAFNNDALGVLILACHEQNCHSEIGNIYSKKRINYLQKYLEDIGINKERLIFKTIASNMAHEFIRIINGFKEELKIENIR